MRKGRTKHLAVDHDHGTGRIRGLLCERHIGIGNFKDDPVELQAAITYHGTGRRRRIAPDARRFEGCRGPCACATSRPSPEGRAPANDSRQGPNAGDCRFYDAASRPWLVGQSSSRPGADNHPFLSGAGVPSTYRVANGWGEFILVTVMIAADPHRLCAADPTALASQVGGSGMPW